MQIIPYGKMDDRLQTLEIAVMTVCFDYTGCSPIHITQGRNFVLAQVLFPRRIRYRFQKSSQSRISPVFITVSTFF